MKPTCIDFRLAFGKKYRMTLDPSSETKRKTSADAWMLQIPCRTGVIYPFGGTKLAIELDNHSRTAKRLAKCCKLHQDGDKEKTFLFDLADFDAVAAIVHPKRRRRLSEEERVRLSVLARRMVALNKLQKGGKSELESIRSPQLGPGPT